MGPQEKIITELLNSCKDQIVSFHEHESLLDHKVEEELSESERRAAWAEYEAEVIRLPLRVELHLQSREYKCNPVFVFPQSATAPNPVCLSQSEDNLDSKTDAQLFVSHALQKCYS